MANIADLAAELGEAKEAKGRAEAKVETMNERLKSVRDERDAAQARVGELEAEGKARLEAELAAATAAAAATRKRRWSAARRADAPALWLPGLHVHCGALMLAT
jgi:ubiquinone biosynthesis protein UbiJ